MVTNMLLNGHMIKQVLPEGQRSSPWWCLSENVRHLRDVKFSYDNVKFSDDANGDVGGMSGVCHIALPALLCRRAKNVRYLRDVKFSHENVKFSDDAGATGDADTGAICHRGLC